MPRAFPKKIETIDDEMLPFLRAMSGIERLQVANRMYLSARRMLTSHLTAEHTDWSAEQIQAEVSRRIALGSDNWPQEQASNRARIRCPAGPSRP